MLHQPRSLVAALLWHAQDSTYSSVSTLVDRLAPKVASRAVCRNQVRRGSRNMGCRCGNSLSVSVTVTVSLNSMHNVVWRRLTNAAFCARNDDTTISEKFGLLLFSRIETHAAHHDSLCTAVPDDGGICTSHANQQVLNAYCSNYALQRFVLPAEQLRAYTFKLILLCMQGGTRAASSDCHSRLPIQVDSRYCIGLCLTMCDRHDATEPDIPSCHVVLIGS